MKIIHNKIKNYKSILLIIILALSFNSMAVDWPGSGACAGTLQACINDPSSGFVTVKTNSVIAETTLLIEKELYLTAGVGFKNDFSDTSSFFAEIDFARFDTNGGGSDSGYEMTFGVRSNITEKLELKGAIEYLDINDDDTTYLVLGAAYNFTDRLAVYSDYKNESDSDRFSVGVRFRF